MGDHNTHISHGDVPPKKKQIFGSASRGTACVSADCRSFFILAHSHLMLDLASSCLLCEVSRRRRRQGRMVVGRWGSAKPGRAGVHARPPCSKMKFRNFREKKNLFAKENPRSAIHKFAVQDAPWAAQYGSAQCSSLSLSGFNHVQAHTRVRIKRHRLLSRGEARPQQIRYMGRSDYFPLPAVREASECHVIPHRQ